MSAKSVKDVLQAYVDAAYAECGIRNHGAGRCRVRKDKGGGGFYWVRVHGLCADPADFATKLLFACCPRFVEKVAINGSGNYVKVWLAKEVPR